MTLMPGAKYTSDKPCKNCGTKVRYVSSNKCVECVCNRDRRRRDRTGSNKAYKSKTVSQTFIDQIRLQELWKAVG